MKAMKRSLVASGSYNTNRVKMGFCLIGDPAVKLAYPEYGMKVTAINGQPVGKTRFLSKLWKRSRLKVRCWMFQDSWQPILPVS